MAIDRTGATRTFDDAGVHSPKHDPLDGLTLPPNVHRGPPPALAEALAHYDAPCLGRTGPAGRCAAIRAADVRRDRHAIW